MRGACKKSKRIVRKACVSGLGSVWPVFKGATSKIWPEFKASSKNVERSISPELFCLLSAGSRGASGPIAYRIVSARTATLDHRGRNRGQRVSAPLGSAAAQWTRPDTTVEPDTASKTGGRPVWQYTIQKWFSAAPTWSMTCQDAAGRDRREVKWHNSEIELGISSERQQRNIF